MILKIYAQDQVEPKAVVSPFDNSTHKQELMGDDVLNLSFSLPEYIKLGVNDYVDYEGSRYTLLSDYEPTHKSDQEYEYNPKFYGITGELRKAIVAHTADGAFETDFSLDGSPADHLKKIVENINRIKGGDRWSVGNNTITAAPKTIEYKNRYCIEALNDIANAFETEWWIEGTTINLSRCERDASVTLGYREGLLDLSKADNDGDVRFITRLIPLGSTRNIGKDYGFSRLQLPDKQPYRERNTQYGIYESVEEEAFADIYPQRIGTVNSVRQESRKNEEGKDFVVYYFKDNGLADPEFGFDPNDHVIAGLVKHVVFQSGNLNGRDFEVDYNSETQEFEIINQYPDDGKQLPGGNLIPKEEDTYILYNISMPESYYKEAEKKFEERVNEYLDKYSEDVSVYKANTDYIYLSENAINLKVGSRVHLKSDLYFGEQGRDSRIVSLTRNVNNPLQIYIECSHAVGKGRADRMETNISGMKVLLAEKLDDTLFSILKTWDTSDATNYNVFSALRSLLELKRRALSRLEDDTAAGLITFLNGAVFKSDFTEEQLESAYSDAVKEELTEGFPETLPASFSGSLAEIPTELGTSTLGDLRNVSRSVDNAPEGATLYKDKDAWEYRFPSRWKPSVDKDGFLSFSLSETNTPPTAVSIRGADGMSTYLHIKYSNDGKTFTENNGDTVGDWMGQYKDHNEVDSTNFNDYRWWNLKGRPWLYADFTQAQLADLRFKFSDFTQEQLLELKGADGRTPVISLSSDYRLIVDGTKIGTSLRGDQGLQGIAGHSPVVSLSSDFRLLVDGVVKGASLRGPQGLNGIDGKTPSVSLSSDHFLTVDGMKVGTSLKGIKGDQGIQGIQGIAGHSPTVSLNSEYKLVVDGTPVGNSLRGPQGVQGLQGPAGHSPVVSLSSDFRLLVDGVAKSDSLRGPAGATGAIGPTGATGAKGVDGKTWLPSVDATGNLSWAISSSTATPAARNIRGPQGIQGRTPSVSLSNDYYLTVDGTKVGSMLRGPAGAAGAKGDAPKVSLNSNYQLVVDGVAQGGSLRGPAGSNATVTSEAVRAAITSMQDTGTHVSIKSDGLSIYNSYCTNVCSMTASATIPLASSSQLGLMSSTDKGRLDTVYAWGNHANAGYAKINTDVNFRSITTSLISISGLYIRIEGDLTFQSQTRRFNFNGNINPTLNNSYDLGSYDRAFSSIYFKGAFSTLSSHYYHYFYGDTTSGDGNIYTHLYPNTLGPATNVNSVWNIRMKKNGVSNYVTLMVTPYDFYPDDTTMNLGAYSKPWDNVYCNRVKTTGYSTFAQIEMGDDSIYSSADSTSFALHFGYARTVQMSFYANTSSLGSGNRVMDIKPDVINAYKRFACSSTISGTNISDRRLKTHLKKFDAHKMLLSLGDVYEFDYTKEALAMDNQLQVHNIGLIAQNVEKSALSHIVRPLGKSGYKGLDYIDQNLIALLVASGQQSVVKFRSIETRHSGLEKRVKELESEVNQLKSIINH